MACSIIDGNMHRTLRIILGVFIVAMVLLAAALATADCRVIWYVYDNCMWMKLQDYLNLPESRFLRMTVMELTGIILVFILYLTVRYVFPARRASQPQSDPAPAASELPHQ